MTRESEDGSGAGGSREGLGRKGVVDVALSVFAEVRPGEGVTALILMLDVFLLLVAYYLLKTVREPLILAGGGVELKNYATAFQAGVLMLFVPAYSAITKRYSRMTVVTGSMLFFASNLVLFWLLALLRVPYVGFAFYVWLGCFSLSVIAQFWSMANDLYTPEQGKRLFAIIGIGSSTGAVAGSFVAGVLGKRGVDEYTTMLLAAGVLVVCLGLSWVANGRATRAAAASGPRPVEEPIGGSNGFVLLMRDRYLLLIALVILLLNLVNTIGETTFDLTILAEVEGRPGFDALGDEEKGLRSDVPRRLLLLGQPGRRRHAALPRLAHLQVPGDPPGALLFAAHRVDRLRRRRGLPRARLREAREDRGERVRLLPVQHHEAGAVAADEPRGQIQREDDHRLLHRPDRRPRRERSFAADARGRVRRPRLCRGERRHGLPLVRRGAAHRPGERRADRGEGRASARVTRAQSRPSTIRVMIAR
jgi:AAA family ATP:ADP antiporter